MRILLIVPGGVDRSGERRIIPALLALVQRLSTVHSVTVVALNQSPEPCEYPLLGARIINLGVCRRYFPGHWLLHWRQQLRTHLPHLQPDVIHALWLGPPATLAVWAGQKYRVPVIASLMGGEMIRLKDIAYGGGWRMQLQIRLTIHSAGIITAASPFAAQPLIAQGVKPEILTLYPDIQPFQPPPEPPEAGPPWRLLTVSTVNRVKDPFMLLQAVRTVVDHGTDVRLDWAGEDILNGAAQRESRRLDLTDRVTFHGWLPYAMLPQFYRQAHLYVQASRYESAGVAVCEAAACGLPVTGTRTGLLANMAPTDPLTSPPGDSTALAENIVRILENHDLRRTMSCRMHCWAQNHHADRTAEQCLKLYHRLTGDSL